MNNIIHPYAQYSMYMHTVLTSIHLIYILVVRVSQLSSRHHIIMTFFYYLLPELSYNVIF